MSSKTYDVCVSGSGVVAQTLALALSGDGWKVAWARAEPPAGAGPDVRTYALNSRSVALLERLRIWPQLREHATAVHDMEIRGDAAQGQLGFSAWQQCVNELAWIVDAHALEHLLTQALRFAPRVQVLPPLADGAGREAVDADLLAVCEGKSSATRQTLGVTFQRQAYGHWGVAARLRATLPHQGVARQWFRSPDVLALLPFHDPEPERSYGLVWSLPKTQAQEVLAMSGEAFNERLNEALREVGAAAQVGTLAVNGPVAAWPLALGHADRWCGPGWVLLGDAAHQVHPLVGQGLNLGLADVDTLVSVLGQARAQEPWRLAGDERLLRRYARRREWPTRAMSGVTDGLLHLFADERAPVRELRNAGMALLNHVAPVKRWLVGRALDT